MEWSDEDQCYIGSCPGLMIGGVHGNDKAKVFKQLCQVAEEVVELFKKDQKPLPPATAGKSYSGKILIRISPQLHQLLALKRIAQRSPPIDRG